MNISNGIKGEISYCRLIPELYISMVSLQTQNHFLCSLIYMKRKQTCKISKTAFYFMLESSLLLVLTFQGCGSPSQFAIPFPSSKHLAIFYDS